MHYLADSKVGLEEQDCSEEVREFRVGRLDPLDLLDSKVGSKEVLEIQKKPVSYRLRCSKVGL